VLFERIEEIKEELTTSTEFEQIRYRQGYIQALKDASQVHLEGEDE
jgi:uncharacterized protein YnzC (UPF0291/DUF896 family)